MAPTAAWTQLLLLGLCRIAATSPVDGLQKVLSPPETHAQSQRKLNGKFLHITGMCVTRYFGGGTSEYAYAHLGEGFPLRLLLCNGGHCAAINFCDEVHIRLEERTAKRTLQIFTQINSTKLTHRRNKASPAIGRKGWQEPMVPKRRTATHHSHLSMRHSTGSRNISKMTSTLWYGQAIRQGTIAMRSILEARTRS